MDAYGGTLVRARGEGDSRFGVFANAADAVNAACAIQQAFVREPWPTLADPSLVPQALAAALGVREEPGKLLLDSVLDALRPVGGGIF
jgi:hypothetical protein